MPDRDVRDALGLSADADARRMTERRGIVTWMIVDGDARYRVKVAAETHDATLRDARSIAREAAALDAIAPYRQRFAPRYAAEFDALRTRWIDGVPAFAGGVGPTRSQVAGAAASVAALHDAGWVHGDLQPAHFLATEDGVVVLDFGLAQRVDAPMDDYRGGMVHFNAPEVCHAVLTEGHALATPQSDVYAFGATVFTALTGAFVGAYDPVLEYEDALAAIASGHRDVTPIEIVLDDRAVRDVVLGCLAVDPAARPADLGVVAATLGAR